jgi:hypothetical protein
MPSCFRRDPPRNGAARSDLSRDPSTWMRLDPLPLPREPRPLAIDAVVFPTALHASFSDA